MRIGDREIGSGHSPYVVAEMSGEHRGDRAKAFDLVRAAKDAGADAIKCQLYNPIFLAEARGGLHKQAPPPWDHLTLRQLYIRASTPRDWFPSLFEYAKHVGITLFASVFDEEGVDYLETLCSPCYKISSFDLTNLPLIRKAASTGKPLIISTGMGSDGEITAAVNQTGIEEPAWNWQQLCDYALLHCVSAYPCNIADANLRQLESLRERTGPFGLSDHTLGTTAAIVATALGASIIEKHITLSRADGGPDASFSLEPAEFAKLVQDVKDAYASLGTGERPASEETYRSLRVKG